MSVTDENNTGVQQEAGADAVDPVLAPYVDSLQPLFEALDAEYKEKQAELEDIRERRSKIERAMRALIDNKPAGRVKDTAPKSSHDWKPSDSLRRRILDALTAAGDQGLTVSEAAKVTGLSNTAVDKALRYLRGDEVRMAGRRNQGALYKLMTVPASEEEKVGDGSNA